MKLNYKKWGMVALSAFLWMADASAQLTLVKDGKAVSRIVLSEKSEINRQAADLLQDFVQRISGASLPIVEGKAKSGDVVIGGKSAEAGEDGFTICTEQNLLKITSGGDKGSIYGRGNFIGKIHGCFVLCISGLYIDTFEDDYLTGDSFVGDTGFPVSSVVQLRLR